MEVIYALSVSVESCGWKLLEVSERADTVQTKAHYLDHRYSMSDLLER